VRKGGGRETPTEDSPGSLPPFYQLPCQGASTAAPTPAPSPSLIPPLRSEEAQVCVLGLIKHIPCEGITRSKGQLRPFLVLCPSVDIPGSSRVETFSFLFLQGQLAHDPSGLIKRDLCAF